MEQRETLSLGRLVAFTDGVFAIAITLLVLNFDEPHVGHSKLFDALSDQGPAIFAYFLSFAVIGRLWLVHHRVFAVVRRIDNGLIMLNLLYLSFVVLIPFTTEVLGDYSGARPAVVLYAAVFGCVAMFNWLMIWYCLRREHVHPEHREVTAPFGSAAGLINPAVFLLSIPVAFVSPLAAELMWAVLAILWPVRRRRVVQRTRGRDTSP